MRATFAGANIKGTPAMKAKHVRHDLKVLRQSCDVFGVQEFKWRWYWQAAIALLSVAGQQWSSFPGLKRGLARPSEGAQGLFWKRALFKRIQGYVAPAFDFRIDTAGIMENRFIRGALLRARADAFTAWFLSAHFVVGGDAESDGPTRKLLMRQNIAALDVALVHMRRTGYAIMGELDANVRPGTWAYVELLKVLTHHGATVHGEAGVEYMFTIPGRKSRFTKVRTSRITPAHLFTDHEIRVADWEGENLAGQP